MQYEVVIYWSPPDQAYVAEAPDLKFCTADGRTRSEALTNLQVLVCEWLAASKQLGRPIPGVTANKRTAD